MVATRRPKTAWRGNLSAQAGSRTHRIGTKATRERRITRISSPTKTLTRNLNIEYESNIYRPSERIGIVRFRTINRTAERIRTK